MIQNLPTAGWPRYFHRYPVTRTQKNINTRRHSYGLGSDYDEAEGPARLYEESPDQRCHTRRAAGLGTPGLMSLFGLPLFGLFAFGFTLSDLRCRNRSVFPLIVR